MAATGARPGALTVAVAVATAVVGLSVGYHTAVLQEGRFGSAQQLVKYYQGDSKGFDARIAAERDWFGTVDVIGHWYKPIPGTVQTVELRRQDPHGPYSRPMLGLLSGRYPTAAGEVAVKTRSPRSLSCTSVDS